MPCLWFKAANGIIRKIVEARKGWKENCFTFLEWSQLENVYMVEKLVYCDSIFKLTQFFAFIFAFIIRKASYIVQKDRFVRRLVKIQITIKIFLWHWKAKLRLDNNGRGSVYLILVNKKNRNEILYCFLHYNQSDYFLRSLFHTCSWLLLGELQ